MKTLERKKFIVVCLLLIGMVVVCLPIATTTQEVNDTNIQEDPFPPEERHMPGVIKGTGNYFEINDSDYLNITFESSEPVHLRLESAPQMVVMEIEAAGEITSTLITLTGFEPLTTYYKYQDDYHNLTEFITNESGSYTYTQDLTERRLVFIQPEPSTIFLSDSGWSDPTVGDWDPVTKTGTLTQDVYETIQIDSDGITLDGAGYKTVTGVPWGYGVFLNQKSNVTIKNITVEGFPIGIFIHNNSSNTTLTDNTVASGGTGIHLNYSSNTIWTGNTMLGNLRHFYVYGKHFSEFDHNIDTTNTVEGQPIYYVVGAASEVYDSTTAPDAGVFYAINCDSITIRDLTLASNNYHGVFFWRTHNSTIENVSASNNVDGINLWYSTNNTLTGNTAFNNTSRGISFYQSSGNKLTGNIANSNWDGIFLYFLNHNNILTGNIANSNKNSGIQIYQSINNTLTNNAMSANRYNFHVAGNEASRWDHNIDTTNIVEGQPIYYVYGESDTIYDNTTAPNAGVFYAAACDNITIRDLTPASNNYVDICLWGTHNSTIENVSASNSRYGIALSNSSNNTLTGNIANSNYDGVYISHRCSNNIMTYNTVSNNHRGIYIDYSSNNQIYNNNFIDNTSHAYVYGTDNVFNLDAPTGGNYWSGWTSPDVDGDGFVDLPYFFSGGQDNLPWTLQDGWLAVPPTWPSGSTLSASDIGLKWLVLTWTPAEHDVGVSEYRLYRDGLLIASLAGSSTTSLVTGLECDTGYAFKVEACDAEGNCSADGPSVAVRTLTQEGAIQRLIILVTDLNLQHGIENSLDAKLKAAEQALNDINQNNDVAAYNSLQAFISAVEAQRGNMIPEVIADLLISATQEIIDGC